MIYVLYRKCSERHGAASIYLQRNRIAYQHSSVEYAQVNGFMHMTVIMNTAVRQTRSQVKVLIHFRLKWR